MSISQLTRAVTNISIAQFSDVEDMPELQDEPSRTRKAEVTHLNSLFNTRQTRSSTNSTKRGKFDLFHGFPKEIQLLIWTFAVANIGPRIIDLRLPRGGLAVPGVLQASADSREQALKTYQYLHYNPRDNKRRLAKRSTGPKPYLTIVNYDLDVVFIGSTYDKAARRHLMFKNVAFGFSDWVAKLEKENPDARHSQARNWWSSSRVWSYPYPNIQTVAFVCNAREVPNNMTVLRNVEEDPVLRALFESCRLHLNTLQNGGRLPGLKIRIMEGRCYSRC